MNKKETKECQVCGNKFESYKCMKRKYCSLKCSNKSIGNDKKEKNRVKLICQYCNKEYKVILSRIKKSKYCSRKCKDIHIGIQQTGKGNPNYKKKIILICQECGKKYKVNNYLKNISKFCNIKCKAIYQVKFLIGKDNPNFGNRKYTNIDLQKWKDYIYIARLESLLNYKQNKILINPNNLTRGKYYHLDHKYSIYDGFNNNVSIENISHPCNLQIITAEQNLKKHAKSCIKLYELKSMIKSFKIGEN